MNTIIINISLLLFIIVIQAVNIATKDFNIVFQWLFFANFVILVIRVSIHDIINKIGDK